MKALLGCLSDPYLHVIVIAVVLMTLFTGPAAREKEADPRMVYCQRCRETHEEAVGVCQVANIVQTFVQNAVGAH
ncbi:MAG: hypothetical protein U0835_24530 [Isosphaeraceae bacterium]